MSYLLDTNVCITFLRGRNRHLVKRFVSVPAADKNLCSVVIAELYYGVYKSRYRAENFKALQSFIASLPFIPFEVKAAQIFGEIRADLESQGTPIGPYDLQIVAIALANDLTLVTHNTAEFSRVTGLRMADWEV
jgi:tRNA(fMet)-specific endonuclease VapC